jgi:hypothetical protein
MKCPELESNIQQMRSLPTIDSQNTLPSHQGSSYILENTLNPWGEKYQPMSFGGKNMKSGREKEGKCKIKRVQGEEKRRRGKEKEKREGERVK